MNRVHWLIFTLVLVSQSVAAEHAPVVGYRVGYVTSVQEERNQREVDLVLVSPPAPRMANPTDRPWIDDKLSREFQSQYELKFGRSEAEINYNTSNRIALYEYPGGTVETMAANSERQSQFGGYMFRRMAEVHVDHFAKTNRSLRPAYELKERIANVDVKVKAGYKVKIHYNYAGNYADFKLENPYKVESKITAQMKPGFGPSQVEKTILNLSYPFPGWKVSSFYEFERSATTVVVSHPLSPTVSSTITGSRGVLVDRDAAENTQRHNLILVGFSWTE